MNVYFDNSATTKPSKEVLDSMYQVLEHYYGNPSSLHHFGVEAEKLVSKSKEICAELLAVDPTEIIFTSGGTESNNLALKGIAFGYESRGKHIITTQIEHSSVFDVCQELENKFGFEITYLPVDRHGVVSVEDVRKALREDTILVSVMHINNELGSVQPIAEIGEMLAQYPKVYFHVDQVQGLGKAPLAIKKARVDLLSLSGHKIHAPKGTGLLFVAQRVKHLYPLFHGGSQQKGIRPGTENVPGIVAFTKALRLAKENEAAHITHFQRLQKRCLELLADLKGVSVNTPVIQGVAAPHIMNVSFIGIKPEVLVHALEEKGIYVSTKSACSSKEDKPSRILLATGMSHDVARAAVRISFSADNTEEEVDYFGQVIQEIIPHYQKILKV